MKAKLLATAITATLVVGTDAAFIAYFPAWSTTGDATVVDDVSFLTNAFSTGTDDATNQNNSAIDPVGLSDLENFVGLTSGGFGSADVTEGSAMIQTFSVLAGETINFDWEFLTNENSFDLAFIVLNGVFTELVNSSAANPGASYGYANSVSRTYTSAPFAVDSTVTLAIGVADTGDFSTSSALRIPTIVPEPSAPLLFCAASLFAGTRRRRA